MNIKKRNLLTVILSAICAVLLACSVCMLGGIKANAQIVNSTNVINIGEITLDDYDSSLGCVFNSAKLAELYSALTGGAGNTLDDVASTVTGLHSTQYGNAVKTNLPEYKTAEELYELNNNRNIVLELGGQEWAVSFLTTDKNGNVIATLWMTQPLEDSNGVVKQLYSNYTGIYSTSWVRALAVNGGPETGNSAYITSASATTTVNISDRQQHPLAALTLSNDALVGTANANKSLVDFITKPFDVEYMYSLDYAYCNASGSIATKQYLLNDALTRDEDGNLVTGKISSATSGAAWAGASYYNSSQAVNYNDWGSDYVWLPSMSETGSFNAANNYCAGLWATEQSNGQIKFNTGTQAGVLGLSAGTNSDRFIWQRTTDNVSYTNCIGLSENGNFSWGNYATVLAVRPALHLNLNAADEASSLTPPTDVSVTYTGSAQNISDVSADQIKWYNNTKMDLTYLTANMINVGTYKVKVEVKTEYQNLGITFRGDPDTSIGETDTIRYFNFKINPKPLTVPTLSDSTQTYKGADYYFDLSSQYNATLMDMDYADGLSYDSANKQFSAKNAGTYNVIFKLKDRNNYVWSVGSGTTADQTVPIKINKKELTANITATEPTLEWGLGDSGTVTLTPIVCTGDSVGLELFYVNAAGVERTQGVTGNVLDVSKIKSTGEYTLCAKIITDTADSNYCADNENYTISGDGIYRATSTITIKAGGVNANSLNWQYHQTGEAVTKDLIIGGDQVILQYTSDKQYIVTALGNDYMDIYSSYNSNDGYVNGFKTVDSNGNIVANGCSAVGKYTTYVAIHITNPDYAFKPENMLDDDDKYGWLALEWEISPRELDFADAEWQYSTDGGKSWKSFTDGMPEYTGFNIAVQIDPDYIKGLGLDPDTDINIVYSGDILKSNKTGAGQNYKAIAELEVFSDSYKTPDTSDGSDYSITFNWQITNKQIGIKNWNSSITVTMDDGRAFSVPAITSTDGNDYSQYIVYTYTATLKDENGQDYVFTGTGEAALKTIGAQASVNNEITVTATASIIATKQDSFDLTGALTKEFTMGSSKALIEVKLTYNNVEYGSVQFGITATSDGLDYMEYIQVTLSSVMMSEPVTVDGSNLSALMEYLVNAGEYNIVLVLDDFVSGSFALSTTTLTFTIVPKQVYIPEVGREIIFTGENIKLTDYLDGYDPTLMTVDALEKRDAGTVYTATITLKDQFNYVFVKKPATDTETESAVKIAVKAVVTGYENSVEFANDEHTAALLKWQINPYVLDSSLWSLKGSEGAVLNLPSQFAAMLANGTLDLNVGYRYYEDAAGGVIDPVFKPGSTFYADAFLEGADASNFVFENGTIVSDKVTYTVPSGGITAFMSNVKDFVTKSWLGLPIWAWLLIGLALLILLIIIIAVACKRRKSKEEKQAIKERKEEEKARREEERQLQREKLEAERELAKAKQEAELEKIRAQAQMAAGVGMASMALQQPQQPQQAQPVQQPVQQAQQPQPMPQNSQPDNSVLAEIRAELAEIRARQNMSASYSQPPMQMPSPQPQYMPMPRQQSEDGGALARLEAQISAMQAEQRAHYDAEQRAELAAMRAEQQADREARNSMEIAAMREQLRGGYNNVIPDYSGHTPQSHAMDMLGALVVAALKNIATGEKPVSAAPAIPQNVEESSQSGHAQYPSDAVITTTTTVDTTKAKPVIRQREQNDNFDVDGFYDKFE